VNENLIDPSALSPASQAIALRTDGLQAMTMALPSELDHYY